jgi:hypothetical protein
MTPPARSEPAASFVVLRTYGAHATLTPRCSVRHSASERSIASSRAWRVCVLEAGRVRLALLRPVAAVVQCDQFVDRHLLVLIGNNHKLERESQRHVSDPAIQRSRHAIFSNYQPTASARTVSCPLCLALIAANGS